MRRILFLTCCVLFSLISNSVSAITISPAVGYINDFDTGSSGIQYGGIITGFDYDYEDFGARVAFLYSDFNDHSIYSDHQSFSITADTVFGISFGENSRFSIEPGIGILINLLNYNYDDGSPRLKEMDTAGEIGIHTDIPIIFRPVKRIAISFSPASLNYVFLSADDGPRGDDFHLQYATYLSAGFVF